MKKKQLIILTFFRSAEGAWNTESSSISFPAFSRIDGKISDMTSPSALSVQMPLFLMDEFWIFIAHDVLPENCQQLAKSPRQHWKLVTVFTARTSDVYLSPSLAIAAAWNILLFRHAGRPLSHSVSFSDVRRRNIVVSVPNVQVVLRWRRPVQRRSLKRQSVWSINDFIYRRRRRILAKGSQRSSKNELEGMPKKIYNTPCC